MSGDFKLTVLSQADGLTKSVFFRKLTPLSKMTYVLKDGSTKTRTRMGVGIPPEALESLCKKGKSQNFKNIQLQLVCCKDAQNKSCLVISEV